MDDRLALIEDSDSEFEIFEIYNEENDIELFDNNENIQNKESNEIINYNQYEQEQNKLENIVKDRKLRKKNKKFLKSNTNSNISNEINFVNVNKDISLLDDVKINSFIDFCIDNKLINNIALDNKNLFSICSSGLPDLYSQLIDNKFGYVTEKNFCTFFQKKGFNNDIEYIYSKVKNRKNKVSWAKFYSFFFVFLEKIDE